MWVLCLYTIPIGAIDFEYFLAYVVLNNHHISSMNRLTTYRQYIATLIVAIVVWVLVSLQSTSDLYEVSRAVTGSVLLLFLPWYRLTRCFFQESEIDLLERVALSFALSISVIPLVVFYLNLAGIPITALMVRAVTSIIIIACMWRTIWTKRRDRTIVSVDSTP